MKPHRETEPACNFFVVDVSHWLVVFLFSHLVVSIFFLLSIQSLHVSCGTECIRDVLSGIIDVLRDKFFAPNFWRENLLYFSSGGVFAPNFWREKSFIRLYARRAVVTLISFRCVTGQVTDATELVTDAPPTFGPTGNTKRKIDNTKDIETMSCENKTTPKPSET